MILRVLRHPWFLTVLSGLLLALCFPGPDFGPLAFAALVPLLIAIRGIKPLSAFWRGLATGFIYFGILYSWMSVFAGAKVGALGFVAAYALAVIMGLFIAVFAAACAAIMRSEKMPPLLKLVAIPSLWVLCEYVRQLGSLGMGWGDLGYTQWQDIPFLRIAPLTGIWGLSWLIVLVNAALATRNLKMIGGSFALILALIVIGPLAERSVRPTGQPFGAAALQANINQDVPWDRWRPADPAYYENTLATYDIMARQAKASGALFCVLAETASPGYLRFDPELCGRITGIASRNGLTLLTGGRDLDLVDHKERNIAALFTPGQSAQAQLQMYSKQQLVPFGEFVPFVDQLKWLSVLHVASFNLEPGEAAQPPLEAGGNIGKIGVAICYESTYPRFLRQQTLSGANLLTVITDDTWFGHTAAARQHLAMSAIRAAECDRYLVRCAATGISAIFAPDGRELDEAGLFTKKTVIAPVTPLTGETFFARWGDWFVVLCAVIVVAVISIVALPKRTDTAIPADFTAAAGRHRQ